MIQLDNLTKVFNAGTVNENKAISDVTLRVKEGDFITIVGSNGAGKTTLFNLISGHTMPTDGRIEIQGADVTRQPEFKRAHSIGRIFQDPRLGTASSLSLEDNMIVAWKKGFKGLKISLNRQRRQAFQEELRALDMGLEDRLADNVGLFSGGQRQALTLLMMVLSRPDLVLLDEHTAALDPRNAGQVMDLTRRFIEQYSLTAMMITHNMNQAIEFGNRLLMMDRGEIIFDVEGEEKKNLTVQKLVQKFHEIRNQDFGTDEVLLT